MNKAELVLAQYCKFVAAVTTGLLGWAAQVVASEPTAITSAEWVGFGTTLAIALGVYAVPNAPAVGDTLQAIELGRQLELARAA